MRYIGAAALAFIIALAAVSVIEGRRVTYETIRGR